MDIESLLTSISDAKPSGVELRNDARFHSIERLLEPGAKGQRTNADGTINESAPDVDWSSVLSEGQALAEDGRDLRLLVVLVRAMHGMDGFAGLAVGLTLLTRSVGDFWDSLHPDLRDRDDPKAACLPRINALKQLENDDNGLLGDLRFGKVLTPRGLGPVSGDDLANSALSDFEVLSRAASGLGQAEKDAIVARHAQNVNRVRAATRSLAAEEPKRAAEIIASLEACLAGIGTLTTTFGEVSGIGTDPGLTMPELSEFLTRCRDVMEDAVKAVSDGDAPAASSSAMNGTAPSHAGQAAKPALSPAAPVGQINSRADVERSLDGIVAFYERTEPSSPIPHLARRMRRMVAMDFLELMEEIAPSGLKEFRNIAGVEEQRKK